MKMIKITVMSRFVLCAVLCLLGISVGWSSTSADNKKPLLVIDSGNSLQNIDGIKHFPHLLLMSLSRSGAFRCVNRKDADALTNPEALEALEKCGEQVHGITWLMSAKNYGKTPVITVTIGYSKIYKTGFGELLKSQDVIVAGGGTNGEDLMTVVARKAARAILFELRQPMVFDVTVVKTGGKKAVVDGGREYFAKGDVITFIIRKTKNGRSITRKVGTGVVEFTDVDSSTISLKTGDVKEDCYVMPDESSGQEIDFSVCPKCKGCKRESVLVDCNICNGQGEILFIKGTRRTMRSCVTCSGKGKRKTSRICDRCNGTGKNDE